MTARQTHGVTTPRALAALAATGLAAVALTACTPDEHPTDAKGTTPAVVTGNQVIPGDLINADDIPASPGSAVGTVSLSDSSGNSVGAASFVPAGSQAKVNLRVTGMKKGQHKVEVRSGGTCDAKDSYSGTGNAIAGGSLPGLSVGDDGTGSVTQTVSVTVADLNDKTMVVVDGGTPIACGVITAN
ncbi:superoxide dismutase family protein [Gordonia sp. (in: high G+C Gram-positive bacteria)]|uniref:superoxide dismutase family protein n=1 Tax=unclassified Gordonia (in: high G+C Gram-positive bacteria) TaxID=2657482 RepID=UPI00261D95B5|nr:superoxide dismutase family protein [Gordonia sp. (in: high G+C Gram-positive bacteria)]